MTVSSLDNYALWFNGLTFGAGTVYPIQAIDGLEGLPEIRNQDDNSGYSDGMLTGTDFLSSRTITVTMLVLDGNGFSAQHNFNLLKDSLLPQRSGVQPLQFQLSAASALQRVNARVRGRVATVDPNYSQGYIVAQVTFFCADPIIYDDVLMTSTIYVSLVTGRVYNRSYPRSYAPASAYFYTTVTNDGNWETFPVITIDGPIIDPIIGNFTQGLSIEFNATLIAGDTLVIDLESKLITLNGVSARNLITGTSKWFSAPVGSSQFYLTGTGTLAGTTQAIVEYRSAYV